MRSKKSPWIIAAVIAVLLIAGLYTCVKMPLEDVSSPPSTLPHPDSVDPHLGNNDSTSMTGDSAYPMPTEPYQEYQNPPVSIAPNETLENPVEFMKNRVTLFNEAGKDMTVMLGEDETSMETIKIKDGRSYTSVYYSVDPTISVRTSKQKKPRRHRLILGNQYRVVWDNTKKCYDVE